MGFLRCPWQQSLLAAYTPGQPGLWTGSVLLGVPSASPGASRFLSGVLPELGKELARKSFLRGDAWVVPQRPLLWAASGGGYGVWCIEHQPGPGSQGSSLGFWEGTQGAQPGDRPSSSCRLQPYVTHFPRPPRLPVIASPPMGLAQGALQLPDVSVTLCPSSLTR